MLNLMFVFKYKSYFQIYPDFPRSLGITHPSASFITSENDFVLNVTLFIGNLDSNISEFNLLKAYFANSTVGVYLFNSVSKSYDLSIKSKSEGMASSVNNNFHFILQLYKSDV